MPRLNQPTSPPTGGDVGLEGVIDSGTRSIEDLVVESGFIRNDLRKVAGQVGNLHAATVQSHLDHARELHRSCASEMSQGRTVDVLEQVRALGFSWRDIARVVGVSVPALRKWRSGDRPSSSNRKRLIDFAAFCSVASKMFLIDDVAAWAETPMSSEAPLAPLDLLGSCRYDLALRLASDRSVDPDDVLAAYDPEWRAKYASDVMVVEAPDGQPAIKFPEA